jgi:adenylyltransferase/sulfurtransferase
MQYRRQSVKEFSEFTPASRALSGYSEGPMNAEPRDVSDFSRYQRQIMLESLGLQGQRAMAAACALIVGVGGLGSWVAELLARAGVGRLRLVDDDAVDLTNIHRQAIYDQRDAQLARPKVLAAADRLLAINRQVTVEPVTARVGPGNVQSLAEGAGVIVDGTDSFAARFLINDFAVKQGLPWVFAGVVGSEAQTMTIIPGRTACLRCVMESPPPPCLDPTCRSVGVLGPAVAAVAAFEACEAMKILAGRLDAVSPHLLKFDLWSNRMQRVEVVGKARPDCPCCGQRQFEYLEP